MIHLPGGSGCKARITALLYWQGFSAGPHLSHKTILKVVKHLRETCYVTSPLRSRRQAKVQWQAKLENVLSYTLTYPNSSTRERTIAFKKLYLKNPKRIRYSCILGNTSSGITGQESKRLYAWCITFMNQIEGMKCTIGKTSITELWKILRILSTFGVKDNFRLTFGIECTLTSLWAWYFTRTLIRKKNKIATVLHNPPLLNDLRNE